MLQYVGFPGGSVVKNLPASAGDTGSIPGEGSNKPLQYSCLENPRDRGAWGAAVHGGLKKLRHNLTTEQQKTQRRQSHILHMLTFIQRKSLVLKG